MAEATVYVASSPGGRPPNVVRFDTYRLTGGHAELTESGGSGTGDHGPPRACDFRIVDPDTMWRSRRARSAKWVHGPQVAAGYRRNPELTEEVFNGQSWPRASRRAVAAIRGLRGDVRRRAVHHRPDEGPADRRRAQHYPDDIEATVAKITGGRVAAISVADGADEQLVVVAETKTSDADALRDPNRSDSGYFESARSAGRRPGVGRRELDSGHDEREGAAVGVQGAVPLGEFRRLDVSP